MANQWDPTYTQPYGVEVPPHPNKQPDADYVAAYELLDIDELKAALLENLAAWFDGDRDPADLELANDLTRHYASMNAVLKSRGVNVGYILAGCRY